MLRHSDLVTLRGAPPAAVVFPLRWPTTVDAYSAEGKFKPLLKRRGPLIKEEEDSGGSIDLRDIALRLDRLFSARPGRGEVW